MGKRAFNLKSTTSRKFKSYKPYKPQRLELQGHFLLRRGDRGKATLTHFLISWLFGIPFIQVFF